MSEAPAFQLYSADFYVDTNEWSVDEVGIYTRLLLSQWSNKSLPDNITRLARIAGCSPQKFQKAWGQIAIKFIKNGDGRLQNPRLEREREKQQKYRELQAEKGKRGAEKRWGEDSSGHSHGHNPSNDRKIALQSSSSKEEEKKEIKKERKEQPSAGSPSKPSEYFGEDLEHAKKLVDDLSLYFKKDLWPWVGKCIKRRWRADAVLYGLEQLWKYRDTTDDPFPYLENIVWKEHQNRNEAEGMVEHEKLKKEELDFVGIVKGIKTG